MKTWFESIVSIAWMLVHGTSVLGGKGILSQELSPVRQLGQNGELPERFCLKAITWRMLETDT